MKGGCHCGAVRFEAKLPDEPIEAWHCNCSICKRTGYLHIFVPHADFTLLSGKEELTSYRFGSGSAEHLFCRHCGIKSFYQPRSHPDDWSVHAACLDEDVAVDIVEFDGRSWQGSREDLPL